MSVKSQNPHNIPYRSPQSQTFKQQGLGMHQLNDGIFKTQPNIATYDNRSFSVNQRSANYLPSNSYRPKPIDNSYARSLPRVSETEYKNPPTRLDDGLYKKLYAIVPKGRLNDHKSPRNSNLKPYLANNTEKSSSMPFYLNKDEVSIFDDAKFKNFMNKYETKNNGAAPQEKRVHFEKESYPLQSTQREQNDVSQSTIMTNRAPQNLVKNSQDLRNSSTSLDMNSQLNNSRVNGSTLQGSSTEASPKTIGTNDWDSTPQSQYAKYHVADEIISPTNRRAPYWPRMEDTTKMRNPIFSSHDFSGYKQSPPANHKPILNNTYSYSHLNPVSPKEYLKTQKATLAQVGIETPVVNHSFKIDSALGMIPITTEEKRSISNNPLKSFLSSESIRTPKANASINSYNMIESNRPFPTEPSRISEGMKVAEKGYTQTQIPKTMTERREPEKVNSPSVTIKDEGQMSRKDFGNSYNNFEKSQFGRMTGKAMSLGSSPILKGGLTGKGTRGFGVFGPNAEKKNDVCPPW